LPIVDFGTIRMQVHPVCLSGELYLAGPDTVTLGRYDVYRTGKSLNALVVSHLPTLGEKITRECWGSNSLGALRISSIGPFCRPYVQVLLV